MFLFFGARCGNIGTDDLIFTAEILAEIGIQTGAADIHLCLHRAVFGIVAGMDDGGIGHGRPIGNVILLLQNGNFQLKARQAAGNQGPRNPCADYHCVISHDVLS